MKFGAFVLVRRGGSSCTSGTPGCSRLVRGVLVGACRDHTRIVRLIEDDPLSTVAEWSHRGDVGRWSPSCVTECKATQVPAPASGSLPPAAPPEQGALSGELFATLE